MSETREVFSASAEKHAFALGLISTKDCPIYPTLLQVFLRKNYSKNTKHKFLDKDFKDPEFKRPSIHSYMKY